MRQELYDAVIVGGGAAGLSAALLLGRARRRVLICDDGRPRNAVAQEMHGFLTRDGTPPAEMLRAAREQLQPYEVHLHNAHVSEARLEASGVTVRTASGETVYARAILLATGLYDALPSIDGIAERWGRSVFVCPYCDGWEVRDRRIAVMGKGVRGVELAQELYQWSRRLLVCLEGVDDLRDAHRAWLRATGLPVKRSPAASFFGSGGAMEGVAFADGEREACDAAFLCAPLRQRYPLVDMLGCRVRADGEIDADEQGRTGIPRVYAAGDAVTKLHQVILAAASGVRAAMAINDDLLAQEVRERTGGNVPA